MKPIRIRRRLLARLITYFLRGLLIVVPFAVTLVILLESIAWMDNILRGWLELIFGKQSKPALFLEHVHGLGVLVIISGVLLVGFFGSSILTKPFSNYINGLIEKTPGIKFIYSSVKDLMEAFVGEKKKFTEPVMVEMEVKGLYKIGFVTKKSMEELEMSDYCAVYFPLSYTFSGSMYLVSKEKIKNLKTNSTELMKFVASGGVTELR